MCLAETSGTDLFRRDHRGCGRKPRALGSAGQRGVPTQPGEGGLQAPGVNEAGSGRAHPERRAGLPDPLPGAHQHQDIPEGLFHVSAQAEGAHHR